MWLNLLNANQDPTFLRSVLYLDIARDYIPAVKANFVRVVINGESWGVHVNSRRSARSFFEKRSRRAAVRDGSRRTIRSGADSRTSVTMSHCTGGGMK